MAALDVMPYLEAVQHGDWETGFGFFADDIVLHLLASESGWPGGARAHPAPPPTPPVSRCSLAGGTPRSASAIP